MSKEVQVIARISAILNAISERDSASLKELSEVADLPVSTVSRLLDSLQTYGLVERNLASKRYYFGRALLRYAAGTRPGRDIASILHPILEQLSTVTGEDCGLAQLQGSVAIIMDRVESAQALRIFNQIDRPELLYCGAHRKVLLAFQIDSWIEDYLRNVKFERYTTNTIANTDALRTEIARIRRVGYATSFGERIADAAGVAAPIFDHTQALRAAIHVLAPTTRMNKTTVSRYVRAVVAAAESATRLLCGEVATSSTATRR